MCAYCICRDKIFRNDFDIYPQFSLWFFVSLARSLIRRDLFYLAREWRDDCGALCKFPRSSCLRFSIALTHQCRFQRLSEPQHFSNLFEYFFVNVRNIWSRHPRSDRLRHTHDEPGATYQLLGKCFAENCTKLKLDLEGVRVPSAPFGFGNEKSSPLKSSCQI